MRFPRSDKFVEGSVFDTRESGKVEIIEYINSKDVIVKFLNTGNIKKVNTVNLSTGRIKDSVYFDSIYKYRVGTIHDTNSSGKIEIIKYELSENVTVRFLNTGNTCVTGTGYIAEGKVLDKVYFNTISKYREGRIFSTEKYGKFIVIENIGTDKVKIRFMNTNTEKIVSSKDVLSLNVVDEKTFIKRNSERKFCVYLHKNSEGVVKYVGEGTLLRAYRFNRSDQPAYQAEFKDNPPTVEIVAENLAKHEAELLEIEYRNKYSDTIINNKHATKVPNYINKDFVSNYVYYDETSPTFLRWKLPRNNGALAGDPAGHLKAANGYVVTEICGTNMTNHRVIWTLFNGDFDPGLVVDHIDGDKRNNAINNLRLVTHSDNSRNRLIAIPESGYRNIKEHDNAYMIIWHTRDNRRVCKSFHIRDYGSKVEALKAVYLFRDTLIAEGLMSERVKEGEKEIE